jgi:Ca2+:H+ antiporter
VLLVFVPAGIATYFTHVSPPVVFTCNALAIIPLSGLMTYATENIAQASGDTIGALVNITFGNMVEVIML